MKYVFRNTPVLDASILIAVAMVFVVAPLGLLPLFDKDEGAFCQATREMVESGNYLIPYMNGAPRYDKPILIYWLQAAGAHLFGLNEFALRLPSALSALGWLAVVYAFGFKHLGRNTAFFAGWILLTSIQATIIAKAATADALLNALIAAVMFQIYESHAARGIGQESRTAMERRRPYFIAMLFAAAVLTKGPVAPLVALGTVLPFCYFQRSWDWLWAGLRNGRAWLLFLLLVLPWPAIAVAMQGREILDAWFVDQMARRVAGPLEGHGGSVFYYLPVLLAGLLPFSPLLVQAARDARGMRLEPLTCFLAVWFVFVFIFFSLVGTKLPHYIVYGYTPLFLLLARAANTAKRKHWIVAPTIALFVVLLALPSVAPAISRWMGEPMLQTIVADAVTAFDWRYYLIVGLALLITTAAAVMPSMRTRHTLLAAGISMAACVNFAAMPVASRILQEPVYEAAQVARQQNLDVVMVKFRMPSFIFYSGRSVEERLPRDGEVILTRSLLVGEFEKREAIARKEIYYEKQGVILARIWMTEKGLQMLREAEANAAP